MRIGALRGSSSKMVAGLSLVLGITIGLTINNVFAASTGNFATAKKKNPPSPRHDGAAGAFAPRRNASGKGEEDRTQPAAAATADFHRLSSLAALPKKGDWRKVMDVEEASVLITGAAGFIGAHTAMRLREIGHGVVGIDNMNNYYDIRLKVLRRRLIERAGATFIQGDVCNGTLIGRILREFRVTHILHLAAQAGVRYSKINPVTYGEANVMCTIRLLEQAKMVKPVQPVVLYASSSSVYGRNASIPFKESAITNKPISIYAATKLATEHVAHAYHSLYNLRVTGLRFFTVYGPMGRPDMAAWMWAKNISNGEALTLYEVPSSDGQGELLRDFTFIDDIVAGVVLAIDYSADYAIFNLGRGQPQNVSLLIRVLEAELGRRAVIKRRPLPAGDVAVTFADTSLARECLGYEPKVSIKEGVRSFVKWFKRYSPPELPQNFTYVNIEPEEHPGSLGIVA